MIRVWLIFLPFLILLFLGQCAKAQYFTPVPNIFTDLTIGDAPQTNANFAQLVAQGNTAINTMQAQINGLGTAGVPVGAVMWINATTCPAGWVTANGAAAVPDLRGVFVRGLDTGSGQDPGRTLGSYQGDSFAQHSHGSIIGLSAITTIPQNGLAGAGSVAPLYALGFSSISSTSNQISGGDYETRPSTIVYRPCYKAVIGGGSTGSSFFSQSPVNLSAYSTVPPAAPVNKNFSQIVSDGNLAFGSIQNQITNFSGGGAVPSNATVPFYSSLCPAGWHAADGTGGYPDLRGRFIQGGAAGTIGAGPVADNYAAHQHQVTTGLIGTGYGTGSILFQGSGGSLGYTSTPSFGGGTVGNAINGNVGTETRPKNVALLYCVKI
jgi:hypothetical protein